MKRQLTTRITVLLAGLAGAGFAAPPADASEHSHHCPAGFEAERAESPEERARDRNGDGIVCVRERDGDREIRDDAH